MAGQTSGKPVLVYPCGRITSYIVEGLGKKEEIEGRVLQIRTQIEETTSDCDRKKLQERLAKMVGGVAVIKIGEATEREMKEKKAGHAGYGRKQGLIAVLLVLIPRFLFFIIFQYSNASS